MIFDFNSLIFNENNTEVVVNYATVRYCKPSLLAIAKVIFSLCG